MARPQAPGKTRSCGKPVEPNSFLVWNLPPPPWLKAGCGRAYSTVWRGKQARSSQRLPVFYGRKNGRRGPMLGRRGTSSPFGSWERGHVAADSLRVTDRLSVLRLSLPAQGPAGEEAIAGSALPAHQPVQCCLLRRPPRAVVHGGIYLRLQYKQDNEDYKLWKSDVTT